MREYLDYLRDIRDESHRVMAFVEDVSYEDFVEDDMLQYAVVRCLEIIGEAASHIPADIRSRYPEVPWSAMVGMRNVLVHHYSGVDLEIVWRTATEDLPDLVPHLPDCHDP